MSWGLGGKLSPTDSVTNEVFCGTAPATPGLLNTINMITLNINTNMNIAKTSTLGGLEAEATTMQNEAVELI